MLNFSINISNKKHGGINKKLYLLELWLWAVWIYSEYFYMNWIFDIEKILFILGIVKHDTIVLCGIAEASKK